MYLTATAAAAAAHSNELREDARRTRLADLAACCAPSALVRQARALLAWARAGQLGAGYVDPRHPQPGVREDGYFQPCCA
jgi:hypothetical protein